MFCGFDFFFDTRRFKFIDWLEIVLKAVHAGYAGATFADVVDDFVCRTEDFAGCAVCIGVPGVRLDYPEHMKSPVS